MDDLISIIVPVYNGEDCVDRCVKSIIEQDYSNWELLIVDGGSQDQTYEICRELSKHENRIHLYKTENCGVSNARNAGLSKALGEWIMFVDADDTIEVNTISLALKAVKMYDVDTVCLNGSYVYEQCKKKMRGFLSENNESEFVVNDRETLVRHLYNVIQAPYFGEYYRAVWGKLFSTKIIKENSLSFPTKVKIGEDALFLIDYFMMAHGVAFVNSYVYCYRVYSSSVTSKYKTDFFDYQIAEFEAMVDKFKTHSLNCFKEGILFWHNAERDLIKNELKKTRNFFVIARKMEPFVNNKVALEYMSRFSTGGIWSYIRTILFKFGMGNLAVYVDILVSTNRQRKDASVV